VFVAREERECGENYKRRGKTSGRTWRKPRREELAGQSGTYSFRIARVHKTGALRDASASSKFHKDPGVTVFISFFFFPSFESRDLGCMSRRKRISRLSSQAGGEDESDERQARGKKNEAFHCKSAK